MNKLLYNDLISVFTKQRLLSLLLVVNIAVSCLVICFSYGIYQNYNIIIDEGEMKNEETAIFINASPEHITYDEYNVPLSGVTFGMITEFVKNLPAETADDIYYIAFASPFYTDFFDIGYGVLHFSFQVSNGKLYAANNVEIPNEMYAAGERVAIYPYQMVEENISISDDVSIHQKFNNVDVEYLTIPSDKKQLVINDKVYDIIGYQKNSRGVTIPVTSVDPETYVRYSKGSFIFVAFKCPITSQHYNDLVDGVDMYMNNLASVEEMELTDTKELYYYKTIMIVSAFIAALASINMAILYRYILEKRSSELAIFRICGCTKRKAIACYLIECIIINAPLFALTEIVYHKLIIPRLTGLFPNMAGAYSFKLYVAIFGIYTIISLIIMLAMITATVHKHSLVVLKSASKATSKFDIMKVFEIIQFSAVLVIMVLIVSAIVFRNSMFTPFEKYLSRDGYMVTMDGVNIYPEDIKNTLGDTEYICNEHGNTFDGIIESEKELNIISYSDEFMEAYAPPIDDGVWLDEVDFTYKDSGYIPAVVTSCDGRYKVGDTIECDAIMGYDENDEPTDVIRAKYKIIGILKDKVSVASYMMSSNSSMPNKDYRDIYNVFSDSFEEKDWLLVKKSDEFDCYNASGPAYGAMFIYCDDMTDEECQALVKRIENDWQEIPVPLSTIYDNSKEHIYEQMYTLFPIAVCIFILTIISTVSINAIYTKRQLRNYAIFYICGARWRSCALRSLKNSAMTCSAAAALSAIVLIIGKLTFWSETVITFGLWHLTVCAGVILLYLALSMIMPLSIIGSAEPREVLKEE